MSPAAAPASPSIELLDEIWRSILELCADLTEQEWKAPTGCPGWTVQDNVSHLVDYEAAALGRPRPAVELPAGLDHLKNPLGESNEVGVEARRSLPGAQVLEELREVAEARAAQLRQLTEEDLAQEIATPAGPGTMADMLTLRVMDSWSHEQDIRRALSRPGHATGPVADAAVAYWSRFLPYIVGKRAGAPDGSAVAVEVDDRRLLVAVEGGRAHPVDALDGEPTVTLAMPATTFAALVGGRTDAPDDVAITGDEDLARRIIDNLGFLP